MEITMRGLWTLIHGMGFGALYLLACSGLLIELYRIAAPAPFELTAGGERFLKVYLIAMAALAWAAVLTGTYLVYPWYRAVPPTGTVDLSMFPQRLLISSPTTRSWHSIGMEWKEHVAWFTPVAMTMAAFVFLRYGRDLRHHRQLRTAVTGFVIVAFAAAGIAGFFGAMLNKVAPVQGGQRIQLVHEQEEGRK